MISKDQPTIFGTRLVAALSSKQDGNLKLGLGNDSQVRQNRSHFLSRAGISAINTTLVTVTYATENFTKYRTVTASDRGAGIETLIRAHADALVITQPNHALFLPLADCVGAIIFDPAKRILMMSHLGRHSAEQTGGTKSILYMQKQFGCDPANLLVWLSPAVGKDAYPLYAFKGKSLQEVIATQLQEAGVFKKHLEISNVDTARNENYYSHSEYLKGNRPEDGRFAIAAMMLVQGEPAL